MNAVSLGPLVMAADRFAVVLGIFTFLIVAGILARRVNGRLDGWAWWTLLAGIGAARLGHVALHLDTFAADPLRVLYIWQGGFFWPAGAAAVLACLVFLLKDARLRLWGVLPLALALVVWNTTWQLTGGTSALAVPDRSFQTLEGTLHDLGAGSGEPRIVNLWATWCPPCRREMPMMAELARESDAVDFIFANQGEGRSDIRSYLGQTGLSLETILVDPFSDLSRFYGAPGLPATLFIDADGILRHAHIGEISREVLQSNIDRLTVSQDPAASPR
ncbi:TlpA disulfide reductase family protein [Stappia stellulata]|uniref:TlpA disulfide reductase family protein n=1 Tax=Stappia stellulata TaxID=71235 RepID=UPI00041F6E55|nr:TlpA disulfide reductase family protein [Stappia stellulata]